MTDLATEKQKIIECISRLFDVKIDVHEVKMNDYQVKNGILKYEARIRNGLAKARIAAASQTLVTEKKNSISFNNEA